MFSLQSVKVCKYLKLCTVNAVSDLHTSNQWSVVTDASKKWMIKHGNKYIFQGSDMLGIQICLKCVRPEYAYIFDFVQLFYKIYGLAVLIYFLWKHFQGRRSTLIVPF